jgi:hypothetical protein
MKTKRFSTIWLAAVVTLMIAAHPFFSTASMAAPESMPTATLLVSGLAGGSGSTLGPGGALFVTEGAAGRISRIDPQTGEVTAFATGLPQTIPAVGIGGAIDVAFIGSTAYVLVTLVGADVGGQDVVGIYRVDGPNSVTPIADIGTFAINNPPDTDFFVPTGVQYALETYRNGFLVTDGHHNRVLRVTLERRGGTEHGVVTEFMAFDNIVPTGLDVSGHTIYMAEAGPAPHLPEDGKIVTLTAESPVVGEVASGAKLLVDVEFGRGRTLFGVSQGDFPPGADPGFPALPNTGALVQVNDQGSFTTIIEAVNQPTSLEIIGTTAYIVTLTGDIWRIDGIAGPPYGEPR